MTAFISPFKADRENVRRLLGNEDFIEIYCKCPVEVCEQRDVKGNYKRAKAKEIEEFTGISSPYEEPEMPDLTLDTAKMNLDICVQQVIDLLIIRRVIKSV